MSNPLERATSGTKPRNWLSGRGNRKEYWIFLGAILAIVVIADLLKLDLGSGATSGVLLIAGIRRFHDLGRTGWWSPAMLAAQFAITLVVVLAAGMTIGMVVGLAVSLVPAIWLGSVRGQPFENRFGPPPGKRGLQETFS